VQRRIREFAAKQCVGRAERKSSLPDYTGHIQNIIGL